MHDLEPLPLEACGRALSIALALFGAWAWPTAAGVFTAEADMGAHTPGFVLLAVLAVIVQFAANNAAAAARRAGEIELHGSKRWSVRLVAIGGLFNAFNTHHAWEMTGLAPKFEFTRTPSSHCCR